MQTYQFDYSQYKKRINKKTNNSILPVLIVIILLLLGLAVFLMPKKTSTIQYYFVEVDCVLKYSDANDIATEIQQQNAGGYVYFDGKYHILASFYLDIESAKQVAENISTEYPNAQVFTLESSEYIENSNLSSKQNEALSNLNNANVNLINALYNLTIKFDTVEISEKELAIDLTKLSNSYDNSAKYFYTQFRNNSKYEITKKYTAEIAASVKNLSEQSTNLSKMLKYELIKIVIQQISFLNSIA